MHSGFHFPQGEQKVTIELTLREAMALGEGVQFYGDRELATRARRKIRRELARQLIPGYDRIHYSSLEM